MRRVRSESVNRFVGLVTVALLLVVAGRPLLAQAQPQKPAESKPSNAGQPPAGVPSGSLEELLARALKENPDIRVAETKLREAEAELNRIRLQVMQKVVSYQRDLDLATKTLDEAKARFRTIETLRKSAHVSEEEF